MFHKLTIAPCSGQNHKLPCTRTRGTLDTFKKSRHRQIYSVHNWHALSSLPRPPPAPSLQSHPQPHLSAPSVALAGSQPGEPRSPWAQSYACTCASAAADKGEAGRGAYSCDDLAVARQQQGGVPGALHACMHDCHMNASGTNLEGHRVCGAHEQAPRQGGADCQAGQRLARCSTLNGRACMRNRQ